MRRMLIVGLLVLASSLFAAVERLIAPRSPIPPSFFGMHIHSMVVPRPNLHTPDPWPTARFSKWRLWDSYVDWPHLEPQRGKWNFEVLDKYVAIAKEHNVEIMLPLGSSPVWASSRPTEKRNGATAPPKNIDDWREFVRTVATRYKGRIHDYEIWNEPNGGDFFSGTPQEMVALVREANKTLKQIDPDVTIVSPAATEQSGIPWLDQFLKLGGGNYVDVIGYHFYVRPQPPEAIASLVAQVRSLMKKYKLEDRPLWNTETGWLIANDRLDLNPDIAVRARGGLPDREASAYIARAYVIAWLSGVSRFYWYAWDNGLMGLTEADGATTKPPAKAYAEVEDWLVGARMVMCDTYGGIWNCRLSREGGYSGWIVWSTKGTRQFPIQPIWGVKRMRDLYGNVRKLSGIRNVAIGSMPILLENRGQ